MKIGITFGTYDLFHIGHLNIIKRAKELCDYLVVGVSDDTLNFSKKQFYPIFKLEDRKNIVKSLKYTDEVFTEESLEKKREYILNYKANFLIMGDDWKGKFDHLNDICKVIYLPRTKDISSTAIRKKIKSI